MSFNYDNSRETADRLIRKFGKAQKLFRRTEGAYDTATGKAVVSEQTKTFQGVTLDYTARQIDGTRIIAGDKRLLFSAKGATVAPEVGDDISIGTRRYRILVVTELAPADTIVMWDCQARTAP